MTEDTDLDTLRGGDLYCCLCQRTYRGAFPAASASRGFGELFCDRLTWLNCATCESPEGHRVCGLCIERYKLEAVPDDAQADSGRPRQAWKVCPDAVAVAQKLMGDDPNAPKIAPINFGQMASPLSSLSATPIPTKPRMI